MNFDLLERLCQVAGIGSRERRVRDLVREELKAHVDEQYVDALGNLVSIRRGSGPRIMVAAHMDEIGFVVRHIDDNAFIRVQQVGGFDPRVLAAQRVRVHTRDGQALAGALQPGTKPVHLTKAGESRELKLEDLFIDTGLSVDAVRALVSIGDMVTLDRPSVRMGDLVVSKALDDRVGLYVMIEALRDVDETNAEIISVATTQEEVGLRGAQTAAFHLEPDIAIALDVTIAGDIPGIPPEEAVTRLGAGTAIKVFDSSQLPHPTIIETLRSIAESERIPHQLEVLPRGGTDAGAIQRTRGGAYTGTISIPCRYMHSANEAAHERDIDASIQLLARFLERADLEEIRYR
ncbi:MAG TPA: M42 family metallopeptidase [Thermomicrobiales bacterium]|nr:M42 family metallopeptidase [Thermomicrobiales bacterium]